MARFHPSCLSKTKAITHKKSEEANATSAEGAPTPHPQRRKRAAAKTFISRRPASSNVERLSQRIVVDPARDDDDAEIIIID